MPPFPKNTQRELDHERLYQLHGDSRSMLLIALDMFLDEVLVDFSVLENAVRSQNREEIADMGHKLVPWLGMVGLTHLETQLRQLVALAKSNADSTAITHSWEVFKTELDHMIPLVEAERRRLN
ncbi:hypothetical protein GCM10023187_23100 [Nibrella viscosa]|uniref:HPt domain-containing protein n=1 Tax=Nibrella viscosa TaxID=1084524 RepID=A0ABP8KE35_9BACT